MDDHVVTPRPVRSKKRGFSCWKCFTIVCVLIVCAFGAIASRIGYGLVQVMREPHRDMLASEHGPDTVIPLIDTNTKFDIALVVHARKPNAQTTHPERYAEDWEPVQVDAAAKLVHHVSKQIPLVEAMYLPEEEVVFSEIVMRDFSLMENHRDVTVTFDLPLARLYDHRIYSADVRGAVLILPQSSVLDRAEKVETARDPNLEIPPRLDDRLRATGKTGERGSVRDLAIEAMAVDFPILSVHEAVEAEAETVPGQKTSTTPKPLPTGAKAQPYFRTRAQVLIVNETRPFESSRYQERFEQRREEECGIELVGKPGSRWLCDYPPYGRGGHLDSRYILSTSEPDGPPQVAYGPQLQWLPQGAGPKHYMSLPVNRSSVAPVQGPDSTTVNITLRMSSVSPAQMFWLGGNSHVGLPNVNVTASEHEANSAHSSWEITLGMFGGGSEGGRHPRRWLALSATDFVFTMSAILLSLIYWYTRRTSTGISHISIWMRLVASATALMLPSNDGSFQAVLFAVLTAMPTLLALRVVFPWVLDGVDWKSTMLRHRLWTHRERASMRKDVSVAYAASIVGVGTLAYWALDGHVLWASLVPEPSNLSWITKALGYLTSGIRLAAAVLQLRLNHLSRTYAGNYALATLLNTASNLIRLLKLFPHLGRASYDMGMGVSPLMFTVVSVGLAYQALTLPRVEQNEADVDEE